MYLDYNVDIPDVKGKITYRTKGNARYVYYECNRTYDPSKKYTTVKRVTIGKVSEDVLFYMMSRGLDIKKATLLLTYSYLKPIIDELRDEGYKAKLISLIEKKEN